MSDSLRVLTGPVVLKVSDELTVRLKFNLLSQAALEQRFGRVEPLEEIFDPDPHAVTETHMYVLACACLHPGSALEPDFDSIIDEKKTAQEEAARLSRMLLVAWDDVDGQRMQDALFEAVATGFDYKRCAGCEHAAADHHYLGACKETDCRCHIYHSRLLLCKTCRHDLAFHGDGCDKAGCACEKFIHPEVAEGKDDAEEKSPGPTGPGSITSAADTTTAAESSG